MDSGLCFIEIYLLNLPSLSYMITESSKYVSFLLFVNKYVHMLNRTKYENLKHLCNNLISVSTNFIKKCWSNMIWIHHNCPDVAIARSIDQESMSSFKRSYLVVRRFLANQCSVPCTVTLQHYCNHLTKTY